MAVNKTFNITLDVSETLTQEIPRIKENDTGNIFVITLKDNGVAVNLTDCRVVALFTKGDRLAMQDSWTDDGGITISGDDHNVITIELFNGSFISGTNECEIQVYSGEELDTLITTASFNFKCAKSLLNDNTILAQKEYSILTSLIATVQSIVSSWQADWAETTSTVHGFIKNKPSAFTPSAHASAHAASGADAITPAAIGAAAASDFDAHASRHASGGDDPVTPASIGATTRVSETVTLSAADWTGEAAPYTQTLAVNGIPADCDIVVAPAVGAEGAFGECEIKAVAHAARSITFRCESKPDAAVGVHLLIFT